MSLNRFCRGLSIKMRRRSPQILTGVGLAGLISAIPLAVIGTIRAYESVQEEKKRRNVDKLTSKEIIKTTWKCYIPTAISVAAGTTCVISSDQIHMRRNAALATAYSLSENALKTYQEKVIETIGEKKEEKIREEIAKDEIKRKPLATSEVHVTKAGNTLCFETISQRYFKNDAESIRKAKDRLNNRMNGNEMFIDINDYLCELGLHPDPKYDGIGWCRDNGPIDVKFTCDFADDEITPCLIVTPIPRPEHGYGYDTHMM